MRANLEFERVLAIETSCDDTSVAIVRHDGFVEALACASQDQFHEKFGGVVPEIASRNHTLAILPLIEKVLQQSGLSWSEVPGLAVTSRPGLVGSLMVGLVTAKTLALTKSLPFIGVNHLEAHLLAPFLHDASYSLPRTLKYPYLGLAVSGGHTQLYLVEGFGSYTILGKTRDDAAGEAFDKFAKLLGLGYPGGPLVDKTALGGDRAAYKLPRSLLGKESLDFSFSGLKSAAHRLLEKLPEDVKQAEVASLCASFQEAIVSVLIEKLDRAVDQKKVKRAIVTGGVSANRRLREAAETWSQQKGVELLIPPIKYCTDNAAMVGYVGVGRLNRGERSAHDLGPSPRSYNEDFNLEANS